MQHQTDVFFITFNKAMAEVYESFLEQPEMDGSDMADGSTQTEKLREQLGKAYEEWLRTPREGLDGRTPEAYVDGIDELEQLLGMLDRGVELCDDELPVVYTEKLRDSGDRAIDALLQIAAGAADTAEPEKLPVPLASIRLLGGWRAEKAADPFIKLLSADLSEEGMLSETVREALVKIGSPALPSITAALDTSGLSGNAAEHLLMALAEIGRSFRQDGVYQQLKRAFLEWPGKIVPAGCLARYGDGRAVTAMRSYLERSAASLDRESFYEIATAIQQLGGRTDDLKFRA